MLERFNGLRGNIDQVLMLSGFFLLFFVFFAPCFGQYPLGEPDTDRRRDYRPGIGIGYSVSIPKQPLGFHIILRPEQNYAVLLDIRWGGFIEGFENYYEDITITDSEIEWEDEFLGSELSSATVVIGLVRYVSPNLGVWAGTGYSYIRYYRKYNDAFEILGTDGDYWIKDRGRSEWLTSLAAGFFFEFNFGMTITAGYQSVPNGLIIGIGQMFRF